MPYFQCRNPNCGGILSALWEGEWVFFSWLPKLEAVFWIPSSGPAMVELWRCSPTRRQIDESFHQLSQWYSDLSDLNHLFADSDNDSDVLQEYYTGCEEAETLEDLREWKAALENA